MRHVTVGRDEPDADHTRRLAVRSPENSANRPRLAVALPRVRFRRLAEMLNPEIRLQRPPLVGDIPYRLAKNRALNRPTGWAVLSRYPCSFVGSISARSAFGSSTGRFYP